MRLEILMITTINVQNSIFIGEVFQIEVSDGPVHQRGSCQNVNLPARVFTSGEFLGGKCLECKRITPMSVQISIFSGEIFFK